MVTHSFDIAVLHGHENLAFAHSFKHWGLKTSDFKPLKRNQQQKRTHFAICVRWETVSEARTHEVLNVELLNWVIFAALKALNG